MKTIKSLLILLCIQTILFVSLQTVIGMQYKRHGLRFYYYQRVEIVKECMPMLRQNMSSSPDYAWCDEMFNQLVSMKYHRIPFDIIDKRFPFAINAAVLENGIKIQDDQVLFFNYYEGWNQKASKADFVTYIHEELLGFVILYDGTVKYIPNGYDIDGLNWGDEN